jgi:peroxin-19
MERMQASSSAATQAASTSGAAKSEDELFADMLKSLGAGDLGAGDGAGSEEDFNTMLLSMMSQLTNKEILYEPMKELHDKFPAWMDAHASTEKGEDLERYREQQRLVGEIVGRFERKGYSDENEGDREYIVERMQKVRFPHFRWLEVDEDERMSGC